MLLQTTTLQLKKVLNLKGNEHWEVYSSQKVGKAQTRQHQSKKKVQCEIATYLKVPKLDTESDPLEWWKRNESVYPGLAKVAKKYLVVPATSAPSERLFSKSGKVVNELRASLKPDKVEMLTFLARNI